MSTVAYKNGLWTNNKVEVCWLFESSSTDEFRKKVQQLTESSFRDAVIHFAGWKECSPKVLDFTVRLFIYDDESSQDNIHFQEIKRYLIARSEGTYGAGHPQFLHNPSTGDDPWTVHVVLNRSLKDTRFEDLAGQFNAQGRDNLAMSTTIHELGHVLGLRHEDAHPERTCDNYAEDLRDDTLVVSQYNPFSFMSRCYYRTFNYNLGLVLPNALDIKGLNILYKDLEPK
jgi:hypothetical protein